ncbi:hypothetical protein ACWF94_19345 [Streptomyces sp. NPDC055078]
MSDRPYSLPGADTVVKTAATYAKDLTERVVTAFLEGFLAGVVITQPLDGSMWYTALTGGITASVSLVKGLAARLRAERNSASLARGV